MSSEHRDVYTHGHDAVVVGQHARRSAEDCAAFLLPHLRAGDRVLDVGCGPGTITAGLARAVPRGRVIGLDAVPGVLGTARESLAAAANASLVNGSVYSLPLCDGAVDAAYAHQVLQHLRDPVAALREMGRVTRPGGHVAARDADYAVMFWAPESAGLARWLTLYREVARRNGGEPDAGRHLARWVREAGLGEPEVTAGTWVYTTPEDRRVWAESWAERSTGEGLGRHALEHGLATRDELDDIARAWRAWAEEPHGFFCVVHVEALATAPG